MKRKLFVFLVIIIVAFTFVVEKTDFGNVVRPADASKGWELVLVNSSFCVPDEGEREFVTLTCGEKVDKRIYPDLQKMFDDALKNGVDLVVRSGYRSEEEQKRLMLDKISEFEEKGYNGTEAKKEALKWVSAPGTSEHQLGIAVDINAENRTTDNTAYTWLAENSYKYGFVLRYPSDKSDITGISYEPWHFRYVGKSNAAEMFRKGLCLEEYLDIL